MAENNTKTADTSKLSKKIKSQNTLTGWSGTWGFRQRNPKTVQNPGPEVFKTTTFKCWRQAFTIHWKGECKCGPCSASVSCFCSCQNGLYQRTDINVTAMAQSALSEVLSRVGSVCVSTAGGGAQGAVNHCDGRVPSPTTRLGRQSKKKIGQKGTRQRKKGRSPPTNSSEL